MTVARQTLHNLLFNHGVENDELLDALAWKFAKLVDEQDALRAERDRLREALTAERKRCAQIVVDHFAPSQGEDMHPWAVEVLAALAKEAGK